MHGHMNVKKMAFIFNVRNYAILCTLLKHLRKANH